MSFSFKLGVWQIVYLRIRELAKTITNCLAKNEPKRHEIFLYSCCKISAICSTYAACFTSSCILCLIM